MKILIGLFFIFTSSLSIAQTSEEVVFPRAHDVKEKQKCVVVKKPCSYDQNQICTKEYCGINLKQDRLEQFITEHQVIGKKFRSLFDLEDYMKNNLPDEFKSMYINLMKKEMKTKDTFNPNRINVVLDKDNYILKVFIG